jgi:hypothetical protein
MQTGSENLVTFLPHNLPFLCQSAGMAGTTVVLQPAVATLQVHQPHSALPADEAADVSQAPAGTSEEETEDRLETDKQSIYEHPLFPLMTRLFEKCEKATMSAGNGVSSESFDEDILSFVRQQESAGKPFFIDNPEVDGLMVRAIQVLRIHVLEIEKVGELCKDFCQRYITSLKVKLSSEQLLGEIGDCGSFIDDDGFSSASVAVSDVVQQSVGTLGQGQVVSGGTVYQMVQTPHGLVAQPIQIQQPFISPPQTVTNASLLSTATATQVSHIVSPCGVLATSLVNFDDDDDSQKKLKRGVLPKRATQIMKSWLFQHLAHPYPTEDEKRQIASQTNLTLLQVNNWFINGRRRILQPMLDSTGPTCSENKPKANKGSTKSAQRFWPENIANLQCQQSAVIEDSDSEILSENMNNIDSQDVEANNEDSNVHTLREDLCSSVLPTTAIVEQVAAGHVTSLVRTTVS